MLLDTELPYCPAKAQETDSSLSYTWTFTLTPALTTFTEWKEGGPRSKVEKQLTPQPPMTSISTWRLQGLGDPGCQNPGSREEPREGLCEPEVTQHESSGDRALAGGSLGAECLQPLEVAGAGGSWGTERNVATDGLPRQRRSGRLAGMLVPAQGNG